MHPQVCPRFCFVAMFHVERLGALLLKQFFIWQTLRVKKKRSPLFRGKRFFLICHIAALGRLFFFMTPSQIQALSAIHDAQGRFLIEDGTVFQAYYFNSDAILK